MQSPANGSPPDLGLQYPPETESKETNIQTKFVRYPSRLIKELDRCVGEHSYTIHMRHNVYRIKATKPINTRELITAIGSMWAE